MTPFCQVKLVGAEVGETCWFRPFCFLDDMRKTEPSVFLSQLGVSKYWTQNQQGNRVSQVSEFSSEAVCVHLRGAPGTDV